VLLERQPDPRLTAYIVWVPKLSGHESDVPTATRFVTDARATHFWDASSVLVHRYDAVLGLGQDAWDVFMIYGPAARWDDSVPPHPDFWMHQLHVPARSGVSGSRLDPDVFAAQATSLLHGVPPSH
jgi:hypothetical protein